MLPDFITAFPTRAELEAWRMISDLPIEDPPPTMPPAEVPNTPHVPLNDPPVPNHPEPPMEDPIPTQSPVEEPPPPQPDPHTPPPTIEDPVPPQIPTGPARAWLY
jgi:hypothetical protein